MPALGNFVICLTNHLMVLLAQQEPRSHLFSQMFARLQLMKAVREVFHSALATLHLPPLSQIWASQTCSPCDSKDTLHQCFPWPARRSNGHEWKSQQKSFDRPQFCKMQLYPWILLPLTDATQKGSDEGNSFSMGVAPPSQCGQIPDGNVKNKTVLEWWESILLSSLTLWGKGMEFCFRNSSTPKESTAEGYELWSSF